MDSGFLDGMWSLLSTTTLMTGAVLEKQTLILWVITTKKHYTAIIFCAKMSLIEINLAQRHIQGVFYEGLPVQAPKFGAPKFFIGFFIFNLVLWVNLFFNQIRLNVWLYAEVMSCLYKLKNEKDNCFHISTLIRL